MYIYNKKYFDKIYLINFLISLIPLSLILGNLATNINIVLICFLGILIYGKNIFIIEQKLYQFLIYIFFIYLILITIINNWSFIDTNENYTINIYKSFFYLRFLIIFLLITKLIENNHFRTDFLFISCSFFVFILSTDIIIQVIFKTNLLGQKLFESGRASSFFGEELIAGGFIQKFAIFFIFYFSIKYKEKINLKLIILLLFFLFFIPLLLTLNRMPLMIFSSSLFLYFLFEKKFKELFAMFLFIIAIFFLVTKYFSNERIFIDFNKIHHEVRDIVVNSKSLFVNNTLKNKTYYPKGYIIHFNTGVQIWKKNKIFGNGLKSFRLNCSYYNNQTCNTHPHNYFIELLVDVGILGTAIIYLIFIIGVFKFFKYYFKEKDINSKLIAFTFFILIFFEFFPLRTSGSFFTTSNSTFIFLIMPIFLKIKELQKL